MADGMRCDGCCDCHARGRDTVTRGERGEPGEKGRRGRRGLAGGRGLTGERGKEADRLKLPRRVFVAFVTLAVTNAGAIGRVVHVSKALEDAQDEIAKTQSIVVRNQCEVLNRLTETKVFIRAFIEESKPETPSEVTRFLLADRHLTEGIRALTGDIKRTPGCKMFPELVNTRQKVP